MWGVSAASSKDLSETFNAEHMFGLIGWANIGLTLFFNIGSIFLEAHNVKFEYRLWANSIFMLLGLVLVGSAPTFWLLLIGLLFTGLSGSFGAVVLLTYMRRFHPTLTGAITSGSGISAIYAYFLYILLHSTIGITSQHIYYVLLLPATLYIILWNLLKPLPTITTPTEEDSSNAYHCYEGESPEEYHCLLSIIKRYLSTFLQRKVWPLCLLLGSGYFMQIMIVGKLVRDSNNLTLQEANDIIHHGGSTWSICHSFEVIGLVYSFGHLL
ncbi:hypothetical protein FOZ63_020958, partial [Perkinsus olseni]